MEASNIKAMREALLKVKKLFDGRIMFQKAVREAHEVVNAALDEPPRNCDVGTPEEQVERFQWFCDTRPCDGCTLKNKVNETLDCAIHWAQMPYEEGDTK